MKQLTQFNKQKILISGIFLLLILTPLSILAIKKIYASFGSSGQGIYATPVSSQKVRADLWTNALSSVGSISADQGIDVTASLPGIVDKIYFKSGDWISKGAALVKQDTSILDAELEGLRAEQRLRQIQFERMAKLIELKKVSKSEFDRTEALLKQSAAMVAAKSTEIQLKTIAAPFDGLLGIRQINIGTYLQPGDPIVQLSTISPVHIDFTLPEKHVTALKIGLNIEINVAAYPSQKFLGNVTAINPVISLDTRNVTIRATIINENKLLRPGMYCEVKAITDSKQSVLTLPETAIFFTPYGNSVFVLNQNDSGITLAKKIVSTGLKMGGRIEIKNGLVLGEDVVIAGQNKLREGMRVLKVDIDKGE